MAGLDLNQFRVYGPGPVQQEHPDYYNMIGGIGESIGAGIRAREQRDLQEQQLAREAQRDVRNDERERQGMNLREREMVLNDKRAGQREELYKTQENRRQDQAMYERKHLIQQEHEALFKQLQDAKTPWEAEAAAQALEREGYRVRRPDAVPTSAPTAPAPVGATQRPPLPGEKTHLSAGAAKSLSADLAGAQSQMLSKLNGSGKPAATRADKSLSADLASSQQKILGALGASADAPMTYEQARGLANKYGERGIEQVAGGWRVIPKSENDAVDADSSVATPPGTPAPMTRAPLPGENPLVTRSSQFLSPGDPYNNIK